MKLFLTSSGLDTKKTKKEFLKLLEKESSKTKVLLIAGARTKEELFYVNESLKELIDIGILKKNVFIANISNNISPLKFKNFDVIYFCGGNTYYLLDRIKKLKFDKLIIQAVKMGVIYLGVSAGSIIVGMNIEVAGWGSEGDKNEVGLRNLRGLGFTNIAIFPHYKDSMKQEVKDFKKRVSYPVKELRNGEFILILNKKEVKKII